MKRAAKIGGVVVAVLVVVPLLALTVAGAFVDREHRASASREVAATPEVVFDALVDVESMPAWREVESVEVLGTDPLRWREDGGDGPLVLEVVERAPPTRLVTRIDDTDQPFGGTWTYALEPTPSGTRVTITEDGWIGPWPFRALARWGWGYDASARAYLDRLEARFEG